MCGFEQGGGLVPRDVRLCELANPAKWEEAFQPERSQALFDVPALRLVEPVDERIYQRYDTAVVDLLANIDLRPHMAVRVRETVFTSVMVFLRKDG